MGNHTNVPKKESVFSVYDAFGVEVPPIPQTSEFGWKKREKFGIKFNPTENDMRRRMVFLLDHLTTQICWQINDE